MKGKPQIKFEQPSNILILANKYVLLVSGIIVFIILLIGYSVVLSPKIKDIKIATEETTLTEEKEANNKELLSKIKKLKEEYNNIKADRQRDLDRLSNILPDNPETAELFVLVDRLAKDRGFQLVDINIAENIQKENGEQENSFKTLSIHFSLYKAINPSGDSVYESFKIYLSDLESSLRLMDIQTISFDELTEEVPEEGEAGEMFNFSMIMYYK